MYKNWIKSHNLELQFWGYELGNILAAVAGVGGFLAVFQSFTVVPASTIEGSTHGWLASLVDEMHRLFKLQPDLAVTVGIGFIVLLSPLLRKGISRVRVSLVVEAYDYLIVGLAIMMLVFALRTDTSWITVSSASFVVASALLRYAHGNPVFLKLGGLFLQVGGFSLGMFGLSLTLAYGDRQDLVLGLLTIATGYYVCAAGMLTYLGGKYQIAEYEKCKLNHLSGDFTRSARLLIHPTTGLVSRFIARIFDQPYTVLCKYVVNPSIFWITKTTKDTKPFLTSMGARLPWRLFTGLAAIATNTDAGVAFAIANLCWAVGDVAIGSIDWKPSTSVNDESSAENTNTVCSSGTAVLLLPGSCPATGSTSVLVSRLELDELDIRQFLDQHNGKTRVLFPYRNRRSLSEFSEHLRASLFLTAEGDAKPSVVARK